LAPHIGPAREYLDILARVRSLKASGSLPVFAKRGRSMPARLLRAGFILGVKGTEVVLGNRPWLVKVPIPDLIAPRHRPQLRLVIKSVSSSGFARLFAAAWPDSRIVVILRHPCGQAASILRGIELGKARPPAPIGDVARSPEAERLGLALDPGAALSVPERLAWEWAFSNQRMLDDLSDLDRVKIIRYEDLAADPMALARQLFAFAGLSWDPQTEEFVTTSTMAEEEGSYYSVTRDPARAANRWRETLSAEDQRRVMAIAGRVPAGQMFLPPAADGPEDAATALAATD
jgi:hypothetical protein